MPRFVAFALHFCLLFVVGLGLTGCCGEPSGEGAEARYKADMDKTDLLKIDAKKDDKKEIEKKAKSFKKEYEAISSTGEERIKEVNALSRRVETYNTEMQKRVGDKDKDKKDKDKKDKDKKKKKGKKKKGDK